MAMAAMGITTAMATVPPVPNPLLPLFELWEPLFESAAPLEELPALVDDGANEVPVDVIMMVVGWVLPFPFVVCDDIVRTEVMMCVVAGVDDSVRVEVMTLVVLGVMVLVEAATTDEEDGATEEVEEMMVVDVESALDEETAETLLELLLMAARWR